MKKNLSRVIVTALILALTTSIFAGCGKKPQTTPTGGTTTTPAASTPAASTPAATTPAPPSGPEPLTLPIVKEPLKLTMWCDIGKAAGAVKTLDDNLAYQEIQKRTGIDIEFLHPPVGSAKEQFNLLVASRQLPDLIEYSWLTVPGGPGAYIKDKVIIPLNDAINKYAPNVLALYKKYPELKIQQEMDDGTYYVMPAFYGDRNLAVFAGPIIRGDWFKKLNMEVPTTIDEWTTMLRAVKNTDLNGDGQKNEIPFHFSGKGEFDGTPLFVGAWGVTQGFQRDDKGKVLYGPLMPGYKEFLTLMSGWYKEGLVDPESLAGTAKIKDEKFTQEKIFSIPGSMGSNVTKYTAMVKPKNPNFQMQPIPYPTLKKGEKPIVGQEAFAYNSGGVAITTACKNVKEAIKLLDYNYSDEGHMLTNWGVEGKTYTMVNGKPKYMDIIIKNPDGLSREQAMAKYTIWQSTTAVAKFKDVLNERDSLPEQIEGREQWMSTENKIKLPPLTPSIEESKEVATIMNEINTYTTEMFNQFVSGKAPISDFDKFVSAVKGMGIDRAIELTQKQLDRYSKRP